MNTGHDGSMGTLHANSPARSHVALESMITMGGFSLPSKTIREMIVGSIDVIIQAERLRDGSRRITKITEVIGTEGDVVITQDLFLYEIDRRRRERPHQRQASLGTGIVRPRFWERARYFGRRDASSPTALDAAQAKDEPWSQSMIIHALALAFLAFAAIGGLAWVFVYPALSGETKGGVAAVATIARPEPAARASGRRRTSARAANRSQAIAQGARSAAGRRKKSVPLRRRLEQAGLDLDDRRTSGSSSGILGVVAGVRHCVLDGRRTAGAASAGVCAPASACRAGCWAS